ncbi:Hypothetical predicted protein [Marmota monax]|uniref:Uncharacterized protein n=1 Tax=Marmota monax TaxID=9995 RepID=A0A5E4A7V4_MARMO|nr:hypothetical protein GHT09_008905 [Marmota monax]VTJ53204.1 Hypothetical predicted protein [Marmota monax]
MGAKTGVKDLCLKPGREGPGAGPERARPRARTLWPPDRRTTPGNLCVEFVGSGALENLGAATGLENTCF